MWHFISQASLQITSLLQASQAAERKDLVYHLVGFSKGMLRLICISTHLHVILHLKHSLVPMQAETEFVLYTGGVILNQVV